MPNYCEYEMKIKGSKETIKRVIDCLKQHYNYDEGRPTGKHFFRVFETFEDEEEDWKNNGNGTFTAFIFGDCAWSVSCCMLDGPSSYYKLLNEDKKYEDIFMGTTLKEQSKDCEIEVFSEEPGMCFSEHYLFKNGVCLIEDCCELETYGYTKNGKPTKRINWDTYDGETIYMSEHRKELEGPYTWTL